VVLLQREVYRHMSPAQAQPSLYRHDLTGQFPQREKLRMKRNT